MTSHLLLILPFLEWAVRILMVVVILRRRFLPVTALAWLALIFFQPLIGLPVYWLVGRDTLFRERVQSHKRVTDRARSRARAAAVRDHALEPALDPEQQVMLTQARRISGNPIVGGNAFEPIAKTDEFIVRLVADLDAAEHDIHLLYYIWRPDEQGQQVIDAVLRAAERGVRCRLLADAVGSKPLFKSREPRRLHEAGVELYAMLPVAPWRRKLARMDLRNHRKIAVIDGRIAYTGSHNLVVDTYGVKGVGPWFDLSARYTGPIVAQLQMVFLEDWEFTTNQPLDDDAMFPRIEPAGEIAAQVAPSGPNHPSESFQRVLLAAINSAQRKVLMTTPYLVPDEPTMLAFAMAVDRGVEVTIVVPRQADKPLINAAAHFYYDKLMDLGVQLHLFDKGLIHAKTMTVDDDFGVLGSANLDIRSFYLNFEINVLMYGEQVTRRLRFAQQRYLNEAQRLTLDEWRRRPMLRQYLESAAALVSPLL